jgi:protein-disulfide isomerase
MEHEIHQQSEPLFQPQNKDRFLPIAIIVAAVLIGGSVIFAALYKSNPAAAGTVTGNNPAAAAPQPSVSATQVMQLSSHDSILGNANAPVTLIEYGDYQCPFCGQFFSQTQPQIVANYVNTGKVKMVFRNFAFLGPESTAAAQAAECARDQNQGWKYSDALYAAKVADDAKGGGESDGFFNRALFLKLAGQVGLNASQFTSCIDGNKYASLVAQEKADATAAGVNSTPTVFINGQTVIGAQPYAAFKSVIDAALAK